MAKDHYYPDSGTRNRSSRFADHIHRTAKASFGTASGGAAGPSAIESTAIRK
jgi:hypothetical protein